MSSLRHACKVRSKFKFELWFMNVVKMLSSIKPILLKISRSKSCSKEFGLGTSNKLFKPVYLTSSFVDLNPSSFKSCLEGTRKVLSLCEEEVGDTEILGFLVDEIPLAVMYCV